MSAYWVAAVIAVVVMIFLPVLLAAWQRRRTDAPWLLFMVGTLTFLGSQAVHLPLNRWLETTGWLPGNGSLVSEVSPAWRTALILGLTAGLCEELARAVGFALLRKRRKFPDALMLGLGHGGIESMIFGGVIVAATMSSLVTYLEMTPAELALLNLPAAQLQALQTQLSLFNQSPWAVFLPVVERALAMVLQVLFSLLVWQAFARRNRMYVVIAILYHAAVDFVAVLLVTLPGPPSPWLSYLALAGCILPGAAWAWRLASKTLPVAPAPRQPYRVELALFLEAFRKEVLEQWRSKRVLIVAAVFSVFGMMSPLLAYFTPEIFKMIEGAEMFASLIPEPSIADAMAQYLKNITQFGFLLAILLGMGAVAGEKERNILPMVLTKPLPRWGFLLAKFFAQAVIYLGGFLLAGLGGYYYTWYLFGPFPVGQFIVINLLLLAWLLPFAAITLLGSTLGKTTTAAGGFSFLGAVILLLSGSLPVVSSLFPPALAGWAGQIGAGVENIPPNAGALATTAVIILLCLVGAVAVFEQQEL